MQEDLERRTEQRLRYHWPVWFAEDFAGVLAQGQMVDVSSGGAAFTCFADDNCPAPGQHITARFSVPCFGPDDSFDMANFTRDGHVCRIDDISRFSRRVAVRFAVPLPFKPGEQTGGNAQTRERLGLAVV
ncbi:MAG: PilZ domain-containing protein [Planctomycetota bacterium]